MTRCGWQDFEIQSLTVYVTDRQWGFLQNTAGLKKEEKKLIVVSHECIYLCTVLTDNEVFLEINLGKTKNWLVSEECVYLYTALIDKVFFQIILGKIKINKKLTAVPQEREISGSRNKKGHSLLSRSVSCGATIAVWYNYVSVHVAFPAWVDRKLRRPTQCPQRSCLSHTNWRTRMTRPNHLSYL